MISPEVFKYLVLLQQADGVRFIPALDTTLFYTINTGLLTAIYFNMTIIQQT